MTSLSPEAASCSLTQSNCDWASDPLEPPFSLTRVHDQEPDRTLVEGVVADAGGPVLLGEAVAGGEAGGREVLLDRLGPRQQTPVGVRGDRPDALAGDLRVAHGAIAEEGVVGEVALHQLVMVAEHGVPRHRQAGRLERPAAGVEKAGHGREAVLLARDVLGATGRGAVGVPEVGVVVLRVVVHDALERREVAGVLPDLLAVEQVDVPADLVVLAVVGVVAGLDGERQRCSADRAGTDPVDPAHHRLRDVGGEHLLRPVGRGREVLLVLEPHRRLGVDDVDVGHLGERQQRRTPLGAAALRLLPQGGAHPVRLPGSADDARPALRVGLADPEGLVQRRLGDPRDGLGRQTGADDGRASDGGGGASGTGGLEEVATGQLHEPTLSR